MGIDLLADMFTDHSPYHFGYNNPISFMDPSGLSSVPASPNMLSGVTDWGRGWEIEDGTLIIEITQPNLPIPDHTVEFIDHSGSYGGGGTGSGSGNGNSDPKGASNGVLEGVQTALDVAGLVPGFGEIADGINAIIYLVDGDYVNASLSMAAMISIGWQLATVGKLGMKAADATNVVYR